MSINASQMIAGVCYIVTKQSIRGEFQVGDRINLFEDGTIGNAQAGGWMDEEDILAATEGMECAPDIAAAERALQRASGNLKAALEQQT
jgi:hypothetical protein